MLLTHTHTDKPLKMWFSDWGNYKTCKSTKMSISKVLSLQYSVKESNKHKAGTYDRY